MPDGSEVQGIRRRLVMPWSRNQTDGERLGRTVKLVLGLFFCSVAVLGLVNGIASFTRTNGWVETSGWVIVGGYSVTVGFEDTDGIEYTFGDEADSVTREGDEVAVRYPPRDPDRAELATSLVKGRIGGFIEFAVFGFMGVWALWAGAKPKVTGD